MATAKCRKTATPEYRVWAAMLSRCRNPNDQSWIHYGGRGITVCKEWFSFDTFIADMGWRPSAKHEIDRIDNDSGYRPDNCRWVTRQENCSNTRNNRNITYTGETKTLARWSQELGIDHGTLRARLRKGMSFKEAVETPVDKLFANRRTEIAYNGETKHLAEWCREHGIKPSVVTKRLKRGWSIHDALTTPPRFNGYVSSALPSPEEAVESR